MIVAIDGPAASGKSTAAIGVAKALNITHLDTGSMYRAVTYFLRKNSIDISSEVHVKKMLDILNLELDFTSEDEIKVLLDNVDISTLIRSKEITSAVSEVSAIKAVRGKMVKIQKDTAKNGNFVVEGRDIGTVVFPDAKYKFFLTADYDVRAQRRLEDFKRVNEELNVNKIKQDLTDRDPVSYTHLTLPTKA